MRASPTSRSTLPTPAGSREAAARKGVELDPGYARRMRLATYYMDSGEPDRAEAEFDKALDLNPGSADLLSIYAGWASDFGEPEKGSRRPIGRCA